MNRKKNIKELREFGIIFGTFLPLIIGFLIPKIFNHQFRIWTLIVGISSILLGLLNPSKLFYPYKLWMKLGEILGWINSRIIFSLIFILILLPISFIMKLLGHNPLNLKISEKKKSFKNIVHERKTDLNKIF